MHDMYSSAFCRFIGKENSVKKMNKLNEEFKEKKNRNTAWTLDSAIVGFQCRLFRN
jgi:hypothetical protein